MKFLILTVLKYTTQWHSLYLCCATTVFKTFIIPSRNSVPIKQYLPFPSPAAHTSPAPEVTSILLSALMIFPFLDTLYKWNHVFVFLFLVFFHFT